MNSIKWALLYGLMVWAIPFAVAMLSFPLRANDRPFFESIMPVAVVAATVLGSVLYFRKVEARFVKEGLSLGLIFLAVSLIIDLAMFSRGPMAMPLGDYIKDIGFTYLVMPTVTLGMGYILGKERL